MSMETMIQKKKINHQHDRTASDILKEEEKEYDDDDDTKLVKMKYVENEMFYIMNDWFLEKRRERI